MHGGKLVVIRKDYFFYVRFAEHSSCFQISRSGRRNRIFAEIGNVCADFNRGIFGELRCIKRPSSHRRKLFGQSQRKFSRCVRLNVIAVFNHVQRRIHKRAVAEHAYIRTRPEINRRQTFAAVKCISAYVRKSFREFNRSQRNATLFNGAATRNPTPLIIISERARINRSIYHVGSVTGMSL